MDLRFSFALLACIGVLPLAQHLAAQSSTAPAPSDFNGDGIPDIVWYNRNTGDTGVWLMDGGGRITGSAGLPRWSDGDINWWIAGVADFNRDGRKCCRFGEGGATGHSVDTVGGSVDKYGLPAGYDA